MSIEFPFGFYISSSNEKIEFKISTFYNFTSFPSGSSTTFPAIMLESYGLDTLYFHEWGYFKFYSLLETKGSIGNYGHVEIGLEVDTLGNPSNFQVLTSITPEIDNLSLEQVKNNKWRSARKDGNKIASYITMNLMYNLGYQSVSNERVSHYITYYTIMITPKYDYELGKSMFMQEDYTNALYDFEKASKWYYDNPELFYNKAITEFRLKKQEGACDDLQKTIEFSEVKGYPLGITKESIEKLIHDYCE